MSTRKQRPGSKDYPSQEQLPGAASSSTSASSSSTTSPSATKEKDKEKDTEQPQPQQRSSSHSNKAPQLRSPSFYDDFICISEFSEIVGPVPLLCLPSDKAKGNFDLEKFVIRIMAVDYQNKSSDPGTFMEDTQVVISEISEDAFAYVHHFTLLDVFARGYVRPICMSYITRHPTKIMENFSQILEKFNKVSSAFKAGNQLVFLRDLEHRMADLYHTKDALQKQEEQRKAGEQGDRQDGEDSEETGSNNVDGIPFSSARPRRNTGPVSIQDAFTSMEPTIPPTPNIVNETLREMEVIRNRLRNTILNQDSTADHHHSRHRKQSHQQESGTTRSRKGSLPVMSEQRRKHRHKEVEPTEEGIAMDDHDPLRMSTAQGRTRRSNTVSSEQTPHQQNNKNGAEDMEETFHFTTERSDEDSDYVSASETMAGWLGGKAGERTSTGEEMFEQQEEEEEEPKEEEEAEGRDKKSEDGGESAAVAALYDKLGLDMSDYEPQLVHTLYKGQRYETKLRDLAELCEDGYHKAIHKLIKLQKRFSRPSIVLALEAEELGITKPVSSLFSMGRTIVCNFSVDTYLKPYSYDSPKKRASSQTWKQFSHSAVRGMLESNAYSSSGSTDTSTCTSPFTSPASSSPPNHSSGLHHMLEPSSLKGKLIEGNGNNFIILHPHVLTKIQKKTGLEDPPHVLVAPYAEGQGPATQTTKSSSSKRPTMQNFANVLWDTSKMHAGKGIMQLAHFSFVKHLVFSLLKGRPVVITATPSKEKVVRELVQACALFVPGHWQQEASPIVHWREQPLRMSDLAQMKVIGLAKPVTALKQTSNIPKSVERYVSILDVESGVLRCPPYRGKFIDKILGLSRQWPDEETYLAYIHYKLLEVGIKASLYYHLCCIGSGADGTVVPPPSISSTTSFPFSSPSSVSSGASTPSPHNRRTLSHSHTHVPTYRTPPPKSSSSSSSSSLPIPSEDDLSTNKSASTADGGEPIPSTSNLTAAAAAAFNQHQQQRRSYSLNPPASHGRRFGGGGRKHQHRAPSHRRGSYSKEMLSGMLGLRRTSVTNSTTAVATSTSSLSSSLNPERSSSEGFAPSTSASSSLMSGAPDGVRDMPHLSASEDGKRHHSDDGYALSRLMAGSSVSPAARLLSKQHFCKQMNIRKDDLVILEYFTEVVKEQQALELQGGINSQVAPIIRLDYSPCAMFLNTKV
ncbi:Guanine nucleotide exchange protein smcr8 [Balamuthia mandrillaris]